MLIASVLLHTAGFAAWALAMDRHHAAAFGRVPPRRRRRLLRSAGAVLWLGGLWLLPAGDRYGIALTQWCIAASAGALIVAALLTWRARWLALAALVAMLAGFAFADPSSEATPPQAYAQEQTHE